jgi:hypothetical protein
MVPPIELIQMGYKRRTRTSPVNGMPVSYWEPPPEKVEELRRKRLARAPGCIRVKA